MSYYGDKFSQKYARDLVNSAKLIIPVDTGITKRSSHFKVSGDTITLINDGWKWQAGKRKPRYKKYYSREVYETHPSKWGWYIKVIESANGRMIFNRNIEIIFNEMKKNYKLK